MATGKRKKRKVRLEIRAFDPERDLDAVTELWHQPEVVRGTLRPPFEPPERSRERMRNRPPGGHALVAEVDGEPVALGFLGPSTVGRRRYAASIGLIVHDAHQGRGVGGRLLDAVLELGERWLGLLRFELEVYVDNKRAIALYRSRGFHIEGVGRAYALRDGEAVDVFFMAKVAEDLPWPHVRAEDVAQRTPPQLPSGPDRSGNGDTKKGGGGWGWN